MRTRLVVYAALASIFVALLVTSTQLSGATANAAACPTNPSPPDPADPSLIVDAPTTGATVTSPVHVSGLARFFEANVRIAIYDSAGNTLSDTFTTAAEAGPALAPFAADVAFTVTQVQEGCVRVFEESAMDGSPVNVVQVEVMLAPTTTPPATGNGGLVETDDQEPGRSLVWYAVPLLAVLGASALGWAVRRAG